MAERLAARADADALVAAPISAESAMQQQERDAEAARSAILARSRGGKSLASSGYRDDDDESYDDSGSGSDDDDSDDDDSEDDDESEVDSDEELDDQASYTEYTETREEADNELLVDSDGDE